MNKDILSKAMKYCAYQERCHEEVRTKLIEIGARGEELEQVMGKLIELNFLNEERFAIAFAGGKYRVKKWGINKIRNELQMRKISEYCINKALKQIEKEDYQKTLQQIIQKKFESIKEKNILIRKNKTAIYTITKGYDPSMVWDMLNKLYPS